MAAVEAEGTVTVTADDTPFVLLSAMVTLGGEGADHLFANEAVEKDDMVPCYPGINKIAKAKTYGIGEFNSDENFSYGAK